MGIIITPGDVIIGDGIEFTGTIISGGSITVERDSDVLLSYSSQYVKKKLAENIQIFEGLFTGEAIDNQQIEIIKDIDSEDFGSNLRNNYVITQNWKIIK